MYRLFKMHRSGFYAWLKKPLSDRALEDNRLLKLIKEFYVASGGTYQRKPCCEDHATR
ncbi:hypothetical protein PCARR_a1537 [Pseudoalteromonas carrageenovora IAM 12662]|uniref:Transposase n=1 Tax=Pseudoalteromonas carrageenovora IAM 12662 TaxID=1314868 RepID=A0ABR9ERR6_PSEVC|nr:hypothetical protein [Pseudoalteromonas carrageenovora IAM 12662]